MSALQVSDSLSNRNEQIEAAAKAVGRSPRRRAVFEAIYFGKKRTKTVKEIAETTGLSEKDVLSCGKQLAAKGVVVQTKVAARTAYEKIDFFHAHKGEILALIDNPAKLKAYPTKRNAKAAVVQTIKIPKSAAQTLRVTVDDIDSFSGVRGIPQEGMLPKTLSESAFKAGLQRLVGEPGEFKDWGGENCDLYTTRLLHEGRRVAAAFALKGPGLNSKLRIKNMGKNGNQAIRLFHEDAEIYIVQHWREIDPDVTELLRNLAVAKSVSTGRTIYYGVMDGRDSDRLRRAYPESFAAD